MWFKKKQASSLASCEPQALFHSMGFVAVMNKGYSRDTTGNLEDSKRANWTDYTGNDW